MKTTIYILCASDRFNYGDLLFPLITVKEMSKLGDYNFVNISTTESDLSDIGALPTKKYRTLYSGSGNKDNSILIIAGGEIMGANWSRLYSFLYPSYNSLFKVLSNLERALGKFIPYLRNPIPFVPVDKRISDRYRLVFHAVGGKKPGIKRLRKKIIKTFKDSVYFSVREKETYSSIISNYGISNIRLTPDSAILMSDFYSFGERNEDYIAFQIGHYKNQDSLELINKQLNELHKHTKYPVRFIPIGNCPGHDDILSLEFLHANAEYPSSIIEPVSLELIMKGIAHAKVFIGTSLHGIVTAMSFSVPYVAINPEIPKLVHYLESWAPEKLNKVSDMKSIADFSIRALNIDQQLLIDNAHYQKELARESFAKLAESIS